MPPSTLPITHAEFFATLCVKIRCTEDLIERRVERRCVGERVCHLLCDYELDCQGYPVMQHDYCKLWRIRPFSWIKETMKEAFAKLGEPALVTRWMSFFIFTISTEVKQTLTSQLVPEYLQPSYVVHWKTEVRSPSTRGYCPELIPKHESRALMHLNQEAQPLQHS
ncbi:hypothetical protein C8R46DRAFT_1037137 [Mycena filopes]|nr:hypothetical protein C8R46DRAFT_1037137 [Mycena filopes]